MDLLKNLKAELQKKRKDIEQSGLIDGQRKFFKREELNKKEEEEYWRRQAEKEEKRRQKKILASESGDHPGDNEDSGSQSGDDPAMKLKKLIANQNTGTGGDGDKQKDVKERILPRKEVIKRLRERNQPILLFAETEIDAYKRLTKLEIQEPESTDKGFRNDFQEAMEKVDAAYLEEIVKSGRSTGESSGADGEKKRGANDVKIEEMNTTIEEILQQAQFLGRQRSKRPTVDDERRQADCAVILKFLKFLLELWGRKLNDRIETDKRSTQGRLQTAIYTQTQDYLKPMFKQLTKQSIADDILKHLILIVKYLLERDYVKANDAYLQMAIGNAPWPIGVTMVGIHARTGREKIFAQNIAHVLNDETQRKYIQGLKRLMTQCQKMFPTDPSRCVEYTKE